MRGIRRNPPVSSYTCRYCTDIRKPVSITSVTYCSSCLEEKLDWVIDLDLDVNIPVYHQQG